MRRLVAFANAEPPASADAVERRFRSHPFVVPDLWLGNQSLRAKDPAFRFEDFANEMEALALAHYRADHEVFRFVLAALADDVAGLRADVRDSLPRRLREALCVSRHALAVVQGGHPPSLDARRDRARRRAPEFLPGVRVDFAFQRRRGFRLRIEPVLRTAPAASWYALALLVDAGRDFARGFARCLAPKRGETTGPCGRFFWRDAALRRYCSTACTNRARRAKTLKRVQTYRQIHFGWNVRRAAPTRRRWRRPGRPGGKQASRRIRPRRFR